MLNPLVTSYNVFVCQQAILVTVQQKHAALLCSECIAEKTMNIGKESDELHGVVSYHPHVVMQGGHSPACILDCVVACFRCHMLCI
jgi:hypothetical protein